MAMGIGVAALVVGLTTIEGSKAISEEDGYQPVVKQKQQNETSQNPVPEIPQYSPL
jgi:hypothetical protein